VGTKPFVFSMISDPLVPAIRGLDYGHGNPFPPLHGIDKRPHSVKCLGDDHGSHGMTLMG